ncbi:MAG: AbrB/MazE/SpoVT family DNA-binding domain-containing protein [Deltaproteobacteria bacterium]|nr:AbrB/MazE/SpoVT family DNA-binding domain-containing protein [Deltaproteobacteria bacterium]
MTVPKNLRDKLQIKEGDSLIFELRGSGLLIRKKPRRSLLDLGGIAKDRKVGKGGEREFTKMRIAGKTAREGLNDE